MTDDGKINHEKALAYIDAVFPDSVKKALIDGVDQCIKDHGRVPGLRLLCNTGIRNMCSFSHQFFIFQATK